MISGNELSRSISTEKQHQNYVQIDQFNPCFTLIHIKGIGFSGQQNTPTGCRETIKLKIDPHLRDLRCLVQVSIVMAAIKMADHKVTYLSITFFQIYRIFFNQFSILTNL